MERFAPQAQKYDMSLTSAPAITNLSTEAQPSFHHIVIENLDGVAM